MLIVEIKKFDPETGVQVIHYLELEIKSGDDTIQDVTVRHIHSEGRNRTRPSDTVVRHHRPQEGALSLVKRALSELLAKPLARDKALA